MGVAIDRGDRNWVFDLTKGILVLLMVIYHWTNYFISTDGFFYRYLRFVTPSFIFITGFLITYVYASRHAAGELSVPRRLVGRGVRLLLLFTVMNLLITLMRSHNDIALMWSSFTTDAFATYVSGDGSSAAFQVLVPISYVLLASGVLLSLQQWGKFSIDAACVCLFFAILAMNSLGVVSGNLQLLGIGFLGVCLGRIRLEQLEDVLGGGWLLLGLYVMYSIALTVWDVVYPLQVIGVCTSLLVIFFFGLRLRAVPRVSDPLVLLGRYSLLGYIAQIAILQVLLRFLSPSVPGALRLGVSFAATTIMTLLIVQWVRLWRGQSNKVDRVYRLVFA